MKKKITYVFPIYNESENIDLLYSSITKIIKTYNKFSYELIFINDGSKDDSLIKLIEIQEKDTRVSVINFSRNFGHQIAVTAGLDHSTGDAVIIMDSDLQDPPKISLQLIKKWEEGFEVVYAQRKSRKDSKFKKITANIYYRLLNKLADIDIPKDTGDFRLLDRKVVDYLNSFRESNRYLRGLVSYVGFKQTGVLFDRDKRHAGDSGYPLKKMIKFALDGLLSFSSAPIRLISHVGFIFSALSFLGILYALLSKFLHPNTTLPGWTFIIIAVLLTGGIQLILLGVLGSYIGRIYSEVQNRPLYIVSSVYKTKTDITKVPDK